MSRTRRRGPPRPRVTPPRRPQILVFVEGERTEDGYFTHWKRRHRGEIIVDIHEFNSGPLQLVERAVAEQRHEVYEARRGRGDPHDEIWCVFDRDSHSKLADAIVLAGKHGIEVAVSNPCFELWLVLHYQDQTAAIDGRAVQKLAREHLKCGKALSPRALDSLTCRYTDAVERAKLLDRMHAENGSPARGNPSSDVWKLVERIRKW